MALGVLCAASATAVADADAPLIVEQRAFDGLVATVQIDPGVFRPTTVLVRLADAAGQPIADARRVDVAFAMHGMNHGALGATLAPQAAGLYSAGAHLLVMEGPTVMALRVERADGRLASTTVDLDVPPDLSNAPAEAVALRPTDPVQVVDVQVDPTSVVPDAIEVVAGRPVRLEVMLTDAPACGATVGVDGDLARAAVSGDGLAELTFTPNASGTYQLGCSPDGLALSRAG